MKEKLINNGYIETDAIICGWSQGSGTDKGGTWCDPEVIFSISNKSLDIIMQMTSDGSFYDLNNIKKRNEIMNDYIMTNASYYVNDKISRINVTNFKYKISQKVKIYYKEDRVVFGKQIYKVYMIEENEEIKAQYKKIQKRETLFIKIFIIVFFSIILFLITYFVILGGKNV